MFAWFNAVAAKSFGKSLAELIIRQHDAARKKTERKAARVLEGIEKQIATQVSEFRKEQSLNIYKTAQLANAFKWTLKEAGFDDAYVEALTACVLKYTRV
jgi:hypothetical protein